MNAASLPPTPASIVEVDPSLVETLAREYGCPVPQVEQILRDELTRLSARARINTFLTVLATSNARTQLRRVQVKGT